MKLTRRKMVAGIGIGGTTALAGCSSALSGSTTLSVEPGGLDQQCIEDNNLEIDSYIHFTDTREFSQGGISRQVEIESYLATYTTEWIKMAVATFPIFRVGDTDILPFSAIDLGSKETINQLMGVERIEEIEQVNEQVLQHDDFDEFTAYEYRAETTDGRVFHVVASEHEISYPDQDDVRMFILAGYPNELGGQVPSRAINMMAASDHPSSVLQEREPTEESLFEQFNTEAMTDTQNGTNTNE